jgi:hypothetical protein
MASLVVLVCVLGVGVVSLAHAQGVGSQLTAPRVKQRVGLSLGEESVVKSAIDGGDYHSLAADGVFLASGPIKVTVRRFNPLATQIGVLVNDMDDPTHATLSKLVEGLLATATVIGGKVPEAVSIESAGKKASEDQAFTAFARSLGHTNVTPQLVQDICPSLSTAETFVETVAALIADDQWGAKNVGREIADWSKAIQEGFDAGSGPKGIAAGHAAGDEYLRTRKAALNELAMAVKRIDAALATITPDDACKASTLRVYQQLRLSIVYDRLHAFTRTYETLVALHDGLERYRNSDLWDTDREGKELDFAIRDSIAPTRAKMKQITVTFQTLSYDVDAASSSIAVKKKDSGSAKFIVQKYAPWVPEIGAGVTFTVVSRKQYGTGTSDGKTVITEKDPDTSNVDPSVMVNMLCGFCGFSGFTPMFQVGASTSKTTPAVFVGGGFRILATTKGDVAVGGGWAIAFNKELKDGVKPGDAIGGTAELDQKLGWRRVNGTYLILQYKF